MLCDNESRMKVIFADGWQRMKLKKTLSAPGVAALKIGALRCFKVSKHRKQIPNTVKFSKLRNTF
jgi:hypothetical protein